MTNGGSSIRRSLAGSGGSETASIARSPLCGPSRRPRAVVRPRGGAIAQVLVELCGVQEPARLKRLEGAAKRVDLPEGEIALAPALERVAGPTLAIVHMRPQIVAEAIPNLLQDDRFVEPDHTDERWQEQESASAKKDIACRERRQRGHDCPFRIVGGATGSISCAPLGALSPCSLVPRCIRPRIPTIPHARSLVHMSRDDTHAPIVRSGSYEAEPDGVCGDAR